MVTIQFAGSSAFITDLTLENGDIVCSFSGLESRGSINTEGAIQCKTPVTRGREHGHQLNLKVSVNAGHEFTVNHLAFRLVANPGAVDVFPRNGPVAGGTVVIFDIVHAGNCTTCNPKCRFGDHAVAATVLIDVDDPKTGVQVACRSPPVKVAQIVQLWYALNGADYIHDGVQYSYEMPLHIANTFPGSGPVSGGTIVSVIGAQFHSGAKFECKFGDRGRVSAIWRSAFEVLCTSPPFNLVKDDFEDVALSGGAVSLQLTQNGQNYACAPR